MKKFLLILCIVLFGLSVNAEILIDESNVTMDNIWLKLGKREQKINEAILGILKNKLNKNYQIMWATGPKQYDIIKEELIDEKEDTITCKINRNKKLINQNIHGMKGRIGVK